MNAIHRHLEVGADPVHFVDECQSRHIVLRRLAPDGFGLRLHSGDTVKNCNRTVEHAKRTFHFRRKINVAWRVDDINALLDPFESFVNAFFFALCPTTRCRC